MASEGWKVIDEENAVLWGEYSFAKGSYATMMVFRGVDGLVVVSPGSRMTDRDFDALKEHGEVRALVANNTYHHLGQAEWRKRFPEAVSYAPDGAVKTLEKKAPIGWRPLSDLKLPSHARVDDPPGFRTGETIFRVGTKRGSVWYTGDLLTNIQRIGGGPMKWLFTLSGSAPGFRLLMPAVWFFIKDRKAVKAAMLDRLTQDPPAVVVGAHGPAFDTSDVVGETRKQLERL